MRLLHDPTSRVRARRASAGISALEITIAVTLFAVVSFNVSSVMRAASDSSGTDTAEAILEDHTQIVLSRISRAVMSSSRETLTPAQPSPFWNDDIRYRVQLGIENGEIVWDDPEMIGMDELENQVFWRQNPGQMSEQRMVWSNIVRPFLEGEIQNGIDDNGNGLIDERGLSFVLDRNAITVRLSLERRLGDGRVVTKTVETTATCRNPIGDL